MIINLREYITRKEMVWCI